MIDPGSAGPDALDDELDRHRVLRAAMPNAWPHFFARFGRLRPAQLAALPRVLAGESLLIAAPTAGGKTEAAVAPLCERAVVGRWPGLSILMITPTRALVNDLFERLDAVCHEAGVAVGRKTADHAPSSGRREQLLITTPESTESLLTYRKDVLEHVRAVVLDEIHLLDGSPRGDQLRLLLGRLDAYVRSRAGGGRPAGLQRLALSATLPDPERVARAYLGPDAGVIAVSGQRRIEAQVIVAAGDAAARARAAVAAVEQWFPDACKMLVFVNSRHQVDEGAEAFRHGRFAHVPVHGHHGSLARAKREDAEARFRADRRGVCVATMTLEVGIDIGDVDLVVCMDPPFSLAGFLQRIGRGCRRLRDGTRVLCVARDRASELTFRAMIRQAGVGLPPLPVAPVRRSVLLQQVLAYLQQAPRHRRPIDRITAVLAHDATPGVSRELVASVLADMASTGLVVERGGCYEAASAGREFIESHRVLSNIQPAPPGVDLVDSESGRLIARVASTGRSKSDLVVAGRSYRVVEGTGSVLHTIPRDSTEAPAPRYDPRRLPYAADVGASLSGYLGLAPDLLAAVRTGGRLVVMTWLGRLRNGILAEGLRRQRRMAEPGPHSLAVPGIEPPEFLPLMEAAVSSLGAGDSLGLLHVEKLADLGPHLTELSPEGQRAACADWLGLSGLRAWVASIRGVDLVDAASDLGADLLGLAEAGSARRRTK